MMAQKEQPSVNILHKLAYLPLAVISLTGTGFAEPAMADGSVSAGTVQRAAAVYGPRIIGLKSAAEKADFAALEAEKTAFTLYNSGAFALNKALRKEVQASYEEVAKAIKAKDAAALKTAWPKYFKLAGLESTNPFANEKVGQPYSGDMDFRRYNKVFGTDPNNL